jgi:hypothetical protein
VKPPPRAAVDAMLAATGSAELSRDQFQAMMRTLAKDGAIRLAATVSAALVCPCVELKSSTRLQCARIRTIRHIRCASRTQQEQSIRPKISRIDVDLAELENFESLVGTSQLTG